jgi:hypothetical protein
MNETPSGSAREWAIVGGVYVGLVRFPVTLGRIDITAEAIRISAKP